MRSHGFSYSLAIAVLIGCLDHATASADWAFSYSVEVVVTGGSPIFLNPDDKPLCVPARVSLKIKADDEVRVHVFRVHTADRPVTLLHSSASPVKAVEAEIVMPDYPGERPADGFYIVAAKQAMDSNELRASAKQLGPLRLSPDLASGVTAGHSSAWIWKGNHVMQSRFSMKARSKNDVAVAVFKFQRVTTCEGY